ncbi:MAG: SpoIIE family protein phosphatase [Anaerosomatales bacterium]|nr:SpoIIE family protein phosphatase [Anaerosomatales bacterium]
MFTPEAGDERARRMRFLHEISSVAISSVDPRDMAEQVACIIHDRSETLFTSVRLANRERSRLHITASCGLPASYVENWEVIGVDAEHLVPFVFASGEPAWGADLRHTPRGSALAEALLECGIEANTFLALPLKGAKSTVGVVTLGWAKQREFTDDDIDFYASAANVLAVGIENAYLFEDERESAETAKRLFAASNQLATEFGGIFESLTDAVVVLSANGSVARANDPARRMLGFDPLGLERTQLAERASMRDRSGTPVPRSVMPWEQALKGDVVHDAPFVITSGERDMRVLVSASPLVSDGVVSGAVLVWRDVTEREELLARLASERQRMETILTSITDGFAVLDEYGVYRYANQSLATMVGKQADEIVGRYVWDVFPEAVGSEFEHAVNAVMKDGTALSFQQHYAPTDLWVEARIYPTAGGATIFASDISEQRKAEQERERLLDAYEVEIARTSLLKDTSAAAGTSLSADQICALVLETIRGRLTPMRGAIHLLDPSADRLLLNSAFGYTEEETRAMQRLALSPASPPGFLVSEGRTLVTHESVLPDADAPAPDSDERWLVLPVVFAERVLGTITLAFAGRRAFTEEEVSLFRSIATQLGIALDNARLYQREHRIADTLQQSLLADPARVDGLEIGRVYRSATENVRVGGDFYDVYSLPDGRVAVSIGDVSGKGLAAAGITALVRNTLRGHSLDALAPHALVTKANEVLWYFSDSEMFATAVYGVLDLSTGRFEYCNGGHPSPLVLRADGTLSTLEVSGPMLGAFTDLEYTTHSVELAEGDVLILYTDGVIEARNGGQFFGEERLADLVRSLAGSSAQEIAQAIADAAWEHGGGVLRDDIAVLSIGAPRLTDAG